MRGKSRQAHQPGQTVLPNSTSFYASRSNWVVRLSIPASKPSLISNSSKNCLLERKISLSNKSGVEGKRTKIVATIGPASNDEATMRQMIRSGMNVARINFSHGDHETHGGNIDRIRQIAKEEGVVIAILCDIQGPKIRIGKVANEPLVLKK